jgi:hypothetical protein
MEIHMSKTSKANFDDAVKAAIEQLSEADVRVAQTEVEAHVEGRAWNMNQPLNMIAYEDQK